MAGPTVGWPETPTRYGNDLHDEPLAWAPPDRLDEVPRSWPTTADDGALGWPDHIGDQPYDPAFVIDEATPVPAGLADEVLSAPTVETHNVANAWTYPQTPEPSDIEQAEEKHLDWLRNLPDSRDEDPEGAPPRNGRAPSQESPLRQWVERIVVGLLAGAVTVVATHLAEAPWLTAGWIGASVLVVVPVVAWVATIGQRSSSKATKATSRVGT